MSKRIAHRNYNDTLTSYLRHDDTASRIRTFRDADGRILDYLDMGGVNVYDYGARADYQTVSDAGVSSGSATLTSATAGFTSADTGKTIRVFGAGSAGADLITTMTYVNSTTVTLGTTASTTISAKQIEWGTNSTTGIQNAINAAIVKGKEVFCPFGTSGIYFIPGSLVTSVDGINPNCQIYIPLNTVGVDRCIIRIRGEIGTTFNNGPLNNANVGYNPRRGVIWKSIIIGTGTTPSVLCSSFANNGFTDVNRHCVQLKDISIQVKSMTGTAHVAPTMSAFNLFYMGVAWLDNVSAFTESPAWNSVLPATGTYGIRLPRISSNQVYGGVHTFAFAQGFDVGIAIHEHDVWDRMSVVGCNKGFQIGQSGADGPHSIIGQQLHTFACRYDIEFVGGPNVHISQVSIEQYPGTFPTSKWYDSVANFLATSLSGASGIVEYNIIESGGAPATATFSGTFGNQLKFVDLQKITMGTTHPSYTVAGVPSASAAVAGTVIYVTNEVGGATLAYSNGTNWKRIRDDVNISA